MSPEGEETEMLKRITRFSIWQTTKTMVVLYFVVAAIAAILLALLSLAVPSAGYGGASMLMFLAMPFIYALAALIFVPIGCLIYNFVAGLTGGIEMQLTDVPGE
jgi:hypothetical protein